MISKLSEHALERVNKIVVWLLVLFGFIVAAGMAVDTAGWDDPVFSVARRLPFTPYSWAALLAGCTAVYTVGEFSQSQWKKTVVIAGALLCATWFFAMSMCMSRMVYVYPNRITLLWPFFTFFVACLFISRVIVYSNAFVGDRWNTNPYQLWATAFLVVVSLSQVIIGVAPGTIFTEIERPVQLTVAIANLIGSTVVIIGLHLRNKEVGIQLELLGAITLVATMAWYCYNTLHRQTLASTTLGFGLAEAFVFGTLHRSIQIITLNYAKWQNKPGLELKMSSQLNPTDVPPKVIVVEAERD